MLILGRVHIYTIYFRIVILQVRLGGRESDVTRRADIYFFNVDKACKTSPVGHSFSVEIRLLRSASSALDMCALCATLMQCSRVLSKKRSDGIRKAPLSIGISTDPTANHNTYGC